MTTTPAPQPTPSSPARGRRLRRGVTAAASLVALVVALSACGSSDESASVVDPSGTTIEAPAETSTPVADEPTTSTTAVDEREAPEEADDPDVTDLPEQVDLDPAELDDAQDRVERVNLTLEDLPGGWVSEPPIDEVVSVVETCTTHGTDDDVVAKAASDRFSLPIDAGGLGLDTSSGYLRDEAAAEALVAELGTDEFAACATDRLLSADGVTVAGTLSPVADVPALGDEVVALQGEFDLSDTSGATAHLSATVVAIRTDQVITTVSATAVDTEGDAALLSDVLDLVAQRQEL